MIFQVGSKGADVTKIQSYLKKHNLHHYRIDGDYGPQTRRSVIEFQKLIGLNADGVVGYNTWDCMFEFDEPKKPKIYPPSNRDELREMFGDPLISGYWHGYGGFCETPNSLNHVFTYRWQKRNGFWCNKLIIPHLQRAYERIVDAKAQKHLKSLDGCYNLRKIRGGTRLSMHSWAIAVDHNSITNLLGSEGDMHPLIVTAFEKEGFTWGGNFRRRDCMHFEYTQGGL